MIAHIPARILYVCRKSHDVKIGWEDFDESRTVHVTPAYPVDPDGNKKTVQSAIDWARGRYNPDGDAPVTMTVANAPLQHVQIVNLEVRGEGGRAYKITVDGVYVDLREDVFLDALLAKGVEVGGRLPGPFIWARIGSQMKLIRVGSPLYDRVVAAHEHGLKKNVSTNEIEIGGVYKNRVGEVFVYLGQCSTTKVSRGCAEFKDLDNVQGWLKIYGEKSPQGDFDKIVEKNYYFYFSTVKKRTIVEKLGNVQLPSNLWPTIRRMARENIKTRLQKSADRSLGWLTYQNENDAIEASEALYAHGVDEVWPKERPDFDQIIERDPTCL